VEEFVEALTGGAIWGVGFGVALGAVRIAGAGVRPVAKATMRGAMGVTDWVRQTTAGTRETLEDVYHEARAEREAEARKASAEARS